MGRCYLMELFAYARVSSKDQNLDRQLQALEDYAIKTYKVTLDDEHIYTDKMSGKNFKRDGWLSLASKLRKGDVLIVKELDRLGRNKEMIHETLQSLKAKGVRVHILDVPTTLIDLSQYGNDIASSMMEMINNVLIEVLGTIAEQERVKIKQRQAEGIAIAKANGVYKGRKSVSINELPNDFPKLYKQWKNNQISATQFAKLLQVKSRTTLYKYIKLYEDVDGSKSNKAIEPIEVYSISKANTKLYKIQERANSLGLTVATYDERIENVSYNQLDEILDQLEFGSGDIKVSIRRKQFIIEVVIDDNEVDLHLLSRDEYENKYGRDLYEEEH